MTGSSSTQEIAEVTAAGATVKTPAHDVVLGPLQNR